MYQYIITEVEDYAIILLDDKGIIRNWNKGAEKIKGYTASEIVGKDFRLFYTDEDRKAGVPERLLQQAIEKGRAEHEGWRVGEGGDMFWANVVITSLHDKDGNHAGFLKITRDLSERVAADKIIEEYARDLEAQVKKANELKDLYYSMVAEVEDYSIIMLDREGIVKNWNKGAEKIKGYPAEDIVGKSFRTFYTDEDRDRLLPESLLHQALTQGKARHEGWRVRKDKSMYWAHTSLTAMHDEHGNVVGFTKVTRDLTEKMLADKAAEQHTAELEAYIEGIKVRDAELAKAEEKKQNLTRIRTKLAAVANKSFGIITNNITQAAIQLNKAVTDDSGKEQIHNIFVSSNIVQRALNNIVWLGKTQENKVPVDRAIFDIEAFINRKIAEYTLLLHPGQKFIYQHTGEKNVNLSQLILDQISGALLANATLYSKPGTDIHINSTCEGGKINITVHNIGVGIPEKEQNNVFDMFFRGSNVQHIEGTGLGLHIAKLLSKAMDGDIVFTTSPEESTFKVSFTAGK